MLFNLFQKCSQGILSKPFVDYNLHFFNVTKNRDPRTVMSKLIRDFQIFLGSAQGFEILFDSGDQNLARSLIFC